VNLLQHFLFYRGCLKFQISRTPFGFFLPNHLLTLTQIERSPSSTAVIRCFDCFFCVLQAGKMGLGPPHPGAALPFFCHNGEHLTQPPPAHMGIPPYQLDPKGAAGIGEYWRGFQLGGLGLRPPSATSPPHPAISTQEWKRALLAG